MLSFRQLQYLVAVADLQHFGRAASSLNVAQPTLSLQLRKLEDHLGVRLVDRGQGTVQLTPVGREIYKRRSKSVPLTGLLGSVHFGVKVYRS